MTAHRQGGPCRHLSGHLGARPENQEEGTAEVPSVEPQMWSSRILLQRRGWPEARDQRPELSQSVGLRLQVPRSPWCSQECLKVGTRQDQTPAPSCPHASANLCSFPFPLLHPWKPFLAYLSRWGPRHFCWEHQPGGPQAGAHHGPCLLLGSTQWEGSSKCRQGSHGPWV